MERFAESTDRNPLECILFGLGFVGLLTGAGGVALSSVFLAVLGLAIEGVVLYGFWVLSADED